MSARDAVVLLSGGLDSATVLALAQADGFRCHAVTFDYGQRHGAEMVAAARIASGAAVASQRVVRIDLGIIGGSALTDLGIDVPDDGGAGIPVTYVPARNTIFLSCALGLAEVLGALDLFIGVNAVDFSGYPDCRPEFVAAFERLANLATRAGVEGGRFTVHAPLMTMSKAEIIKTGSAHGVDYAQTVSCYRADDDGRACGHCDSCRIRAQGFADAGLDDPTRYRA
jgi:7-cyano-7-deazaguanine synthase